MGKILSRFLHRKRQNPEEVYGLVDFRTLAKQTPFKKKQLKKWYQEFLKDCPRGFMTKECFVQNFQDIFFPRELMNIGKLSDYIFTKFDQNKDGVITFDEFIKAIAIPATGSVDEKLDWAFSIYDVDDDGFVTREEMIKIVRAVFERKGCSESQSALVESRVETIFSEMDANNDDMLSREEFIAGFKNDPSIIRTILDQQHPTIPSISKHS